MLKSLCFRFLLFAIAPWIAQAQVNGTLYGTVVDASGAVVAGAAITVKNADTGMARAAVSDQTGAYRVESLPVGLQEVRAEKPGFKVAVRKGINLAIAQQARVDLTLEVGNASIQLTVTEEIPVVNTSPSSIAGLVGERAVKDLPLNGRSFDNLMALNPSTINYGLKSANTSTSNGNTFSVAGRRPMDNLVLLNGIEYSGTSQLAVTPGGVSGQLVGIEAVREFSVQTDTYSAEYGKRSGGQVSVVTQSGSNALHGSIYEFLRNNKLDARNFFDQGKIPPFKRNQFGVALGGPIRKDKLFVFGNYEGFRQALAVSSVSVVPDALARTGMVPNATTGIYATVANLKPVMLQYMSFWPLPNGPELLSSGLPSGTALSYNNPRQSIHEDFGTSRVDYIIGANDTLTASYTIDDGTSLTPLADPLFGSNLALRNQVASLQETHVLSPRTLNTFRFGYSRAGFNYEPAAVTPLDPALSFVSGFGPGGIIVNGGVTTTGLSGITAAGPNNASNVWNRRNLFTFSDDLQMTRGAHQISAGIWLQRLRDNENTASRAQGVATFASLTTFLQGTTTTFQVVPSPNELGWRSLLGAWYLNDTIRLRRNLTLQLGLRHEFTNGWNEVSGRAANYITDGNSVLLTAPRVSNSAFTVNNATKLFAPRIAVAWDVFGNGKTAFRAGFGTYYSLIDDLAFLLNSLPPANGSATFTGALSGIVPITPGVQPPQACGPGVPTPCSTFAPQGVQPDAQTPTVQEWNARIEQRLSESTALRISYVGSFGYHGLISVDPNSVPAQICAAATCATGGTGAARGVVQQGEQYIPVVATRPNPYLGAGFFWYTEGNTSYNALQFDVTRRMSRGLQLRANFTWSKNLDMNSALTIAQGSNQPQMVMNRNDLHRDWGLSALNVTGQGSISGSYELPFGKQGRFRKLAGGWQLNGIATMLSGFPFTPQIGANRSGDGDTRNPDRPNLNPAFTGSVYKRTPNQWFDPNAFSLPTVGTWGNLGRGTFTGPGLGSVDISLFKTTAITERLHLQFRAECFNIQNRANFGTPNAIVYSGATFNPSAGLITTTTTASRQIQFGMKLVF